MKSETIVSIRNLTKIYHLYDKHIDRLKEALHPFRKRYRHDFYALENVRFEIKKGETVGIIGRNGAGKSTLLKILTGVLSPTSGIVHINGRVTSLLELGTGFSPELTGIENIYFYGTINDMPREEMAKKEAEIIAFADIGEFIDQPVKTYSSGMFARLAFAVAINIDPDILIVDEILSVGDVAFQRKCFAKFEEFKKNSKTIIFVSHNVNQVVEFCSRAILFYSGKILLDGIPKHVINQYLKIINNQSANIDRALEVYTENLSKENSSDDSHEKITYLEEEFVEYFDPNIILKSTVTYDEIEATITDVSLKTIDGRKVNVVFTGRKYIYSYKVVLKDDLRMLNVGMYIKTISGIEIGGGNFPGCNKYIDVGKNEEITIRWEFICCLCPGYYCFNAGVTSLENKGNFNHRILDAYMMRVCSTNKHNDSIGIVDFSVSMLGFEKSMKGKNL